MEGLVEHWASRNDAPAVTETGGVHCLSPQGPSVESRSAIYKYTREAPRLYMYTDILARRFDVCSCQREWSYTQGYIELWLIWSLHA